MTGLPHPGFRSGARRPGRRAKLARDRLTGAGRLSSANSALRQLGRSDGVWQGQAAQAFARRVGELPQHLADGENSMSAACRALSSWSAELVDFQRRAAAYERQAADAAAAVSSARAATTAIARPGANASQAEVEEATRQATQAKHKLDAASDELSRNHREGPRAARRTRRGGPPGREVAPRRFRRRTGQTGVFPIARQRLERRHGLRDHPGGQGSALGQ